MGTRTKVQIPTGENVSGTLVSIDESVERYSEIKLSDGSVLRVKVNVVEVIRLDDRHDDNGNPVYAIKSSNHILVSSAPSELKRESH